MWMTLLALRNSIAILMASLAVVVLGLVALTDPKTGNQYNVVVQLDEPYRQPLKDLGRIVVASDDAELAPVRALP